MNTTDESRSRKADRASVDAPDFSLELSGGLESESIDEYNTLESIITLDPEVLASLVVQLRTNSLVTWPSSKHAFTSWKAQENARSNT